MSEPAARIASEVAKQIEIDLWHMNIQQAMKSLQDDRLANLSVLLSTDVRGSGVGKTQHRNRWPTGTIDGS